MKKILMILLVLMLLAGCTSKNNKENPLDNNPIGIPNDENPDTEEPVTEEPVTEEPVDLTGEVRLGIDNIDDHLEIFGDLRVGLITNQTGINSNYVSTIDVLYEKVNLVSLFAPEHGIRGELQAGSYVASYTDQKTGIVVNSLYGQTQKPTKAMMDNIDIMAIDLQDAGARFYTYIYTMAYAMEAAAEYNKKFVVFDRPNPAGGHIVQGTILKNEYKSFVGNYPIVQRHGMTIGELAELFNDEYNIGCDLEVIKMTGYDRRMFFDDTKLPWVIPSPNFPSQNTALVYTGTCIFEGTNLSEGRGTTIPFEVIGAPYINSIELADALNALGLPGVKFRPASFTPTFSKHKDVLVHGVQVHVTNRETFESVKTGFAMVDVIRDMYPTQFQILNASNSRNMMNLLTGTNVITNDTLTLSEQFELIDRETNIFMQIRNRYLLY